MDSTGMRYREIIVPAHRRQVVLAALAYLGVLAGAMTLYWQTMAPDVVWHDAGYYQVEAAKLNLVRPGETVRVHPVFLLIAHGLGRLGPWNPARAASVASALGTALAVANVWLIVWLAARRWAPAFLAAVVCMLAHTIWQLGVQPQTYGWSNAALSGMIAAAVVYAQTQRTRWLLAAFFIAGVGMGVHLMSQLAVPVLGVWMVTRILRGRTPAWALPAAAAAWLVGAAPFGYVVTLEFMRTHDAWATAESALLGGWGGAVFNVDEVPHMLLRSLLMLGLNFPTPLVLLAVVGLVRGRRLFEGTALAAVLAAVLIIAAVFAARYKVPNQNFFFTPAYMLVAAYIGLGAASWAGARRPLAMVLLFAAAVAVVPVYHAGARVARNTGFNLRADGKMHDIPYRDIYEYYILPWQHTQTGPRRFAEEVLESLPPQAVLLPDTTTAPPLKYLHEVEGRRPDIRIVDPYDARFDESVRAWWGRQNMLPRAAEEGRPVFVASDDPRYVPPWVAEHGRLERAGHAFRVQPKAAETTEPEKPAEAEMPAEAGAPKPAEASP